MCERCQVDNQLLHLFAKNASAIVTESAAIAYLF